MTALLLSFLSNPTMLAIMGGLLAALVAFLKGNSRGARIERDKQAAKNLAAAEDRLEMDREATEAERKAAGMTDDEARSEALKWSRPR